MTDELVVLRQFLHSSPDLSGQEENTSGIVRSFLDKCSPDDLITGLGGFGLAALFNGRQSGPGILIRCELDALPIPETIELDYRSQHPERAHKCGHDGHMAILAGVALHLKEHPPARGSVVLLFQPSEETGEGAALVISDPQFEQIQPDYVFALHNLPGFHLGEVVLSDGPFASASCGLTIELKGATAHAAEPQKGISPALAVAELIESISSLPQFHTALHESAQATIIHARVGEVAFGTSPGSGVVMATLRSHSEQTMNTMIDRATSLAQGIAATHKLEVVIATKQPFPATVNHPEAAALVRQSAEKLGMKTRELEVPFPWSEDFGHFTAKYKGALFGLGAGRNQPALHHPHYDFPDELIARGVRLFTALIQSMVGKLQ